jgi:hypothetical protein
MIKELTGQYMVYPGHPLVLATVIMSVFDSFGDASDSNADGRSRAITSDAIPGAGDHASAALRVLAVGANDGTLDEMVEYARRYWNENQAGGHRDSVAKGNTQADRIEPHFRAKAAAWFQLPPPDGKPVN